MSDNITGDNLTVTDINNDLSGDNEPALSLNTVNAEIDFDDNHIFKARVFLEDNSSTYGAEVVIYSSRSSEPIETILITDLSKFNEFGYNIDLIKSNFIPYSKQDKANLDVILDYLTESDATEKADKETAYNTAINSPSYLKNIGDLQSILENNISDNVSQEDLDDYHSKGDVVINASHLDGKDSGAFSKVDHTHDNYLSFNHSSVLGDEVNYGHVKIVDNLVTRTNNGEVLSAKQGYELNNKIDNLDKKITNSWGYYLVNDRLSYRVNELLHLVVCEYDFPNCNLFKSKTGLHDLEVKGSIDARYCPSSIVNSSVYRGDINFMVNPDGSIKIHNLTLHESWNIKLQVLWYY